jgi:tripartite-type tricarboxylate transporter receptor subunit TctC
MKNILNLVMALSVSLMVLCPQSALAQAYPTKPIEIVCAWGPGSSADIVSRLIADLAPKYLGQPVVVTPRPGGAGSMAAGHVISSEPDGYKLFSNQHAYFATTVQTQKVPFDPRDLVPVASFAEVRQAMGVRADSPFKTLSDLVAYARKNPGQLKWNHPGRGNPLYIAPTLVFRREGVSTIEVPIKGAMNEGMVNLLGGHVDMVSITYAAMTDQVKAGKVTALMYYSYKRYPDSPNVPSAADLGYADAVVPSYTSLFIHKNTPQNIQKTLQDAFKRVYDDPEFKKGLAKVEFDPMWGGSDFVMESIKGSQTIAIPILKELGLYTGK